MPTASTVRRITPPMQRNFGKIYDVHPVPDLTEIQTRSYERFLQADLPAEDRAHLLGAEERVEADCVFCGTRYSYDLEELAP